ncbi:MAG: hypothetical protein AB1664_21980, partial [Thermodesulfobacteriota bacterium]
VHLLLLPTPPRGDAVTVGYRPEKVYLERTCTSLIKYARRRTGTAFLSGPISHELNRKRRDEPRNGDFPTGSGI